MLKNVDLTVNPGEKVILCGPSGSGKSSLIMATLMMMEVQEGSIKIDDTNINTVAGNDLRLHLNVVPQDPFFMPGTVRFNIDPKGQSTDESIQLALGNVGLWDKIDSKGGLDAALDPSELSHGEKQLMCLARAMLVKSQILILDEAMSRYVGPSHTTVFARLTDFHHSVDSATEAKMQQIVDTEFQSQTVISVLHRFDHVKSYNRVVVLRSGEIVESGTPDALLASNSAFRDLYNVKSA